MTTGTDGSLLSGEEREAFVTRLFDRIARPYDRLNRLISLGRDVRWRREALDLTGVATGHDAVDLGCGTGDLFLELRERVGATGSVIGLDISAGMLELAREKSRTRYPDVPHDLRLGSAAATGLPPASADLVTMGWVLRNVGDRQAVYREIQRILRPGGAFLSIDMSRPESAPLRLGSALYLRGVMPLAVRLFGGDAEAYRYLARSTARFPMRSELVREWEQAGFVDVQSRTTMLGCIAIIVGRVKADASPAR